MSGPATSRPGGNGSGAKPSGAKLDAEDFTTAEERRLAQLRVIGRRWRALQTRLNTVTTLVNAYKRRP